MRLTRVVIESDGRRFHLDLHPGLSVVSGLDAPARRSLGRALVTAMGAGRPGLHTEVLTDDGRQLAVFRPPSQPPRVVDVDRAEDVTATFADPNGAPDLLGHFGVPPARAPEVVLLRAGDLESRSVVEQRILDLARLDQGRLWDVADKVAERAARLSDLGAEPEAFDPDTVAEIERRHRAFEAAQAEHERAQRVWLLFGANVGLMAAPAAVLAGWFVALPFLVVAAAMAGWSAREWRLVERARRDESEALGDAGARSYLAFQLSLVDRALVTESHRRRATQALAAHRAALDEWRLLAGDIEAGWVLEHRRQIRDTAARLRAGHHPTSPATLPVDDSTNDVLERLRARVGEASRVATESIPLVCSDLFDAAERPAVAPLLEALLDVARRRQVLVLSDDPEVTAWARVERLTGDVGLVESTPVR